MTKEQYRKKIEEIKERIRVLEDRQKKYEEEMRIADDAMCRAILKRYRVDSEELVELLSRRDEELKKIRNGQGRSDDKSADEADNTKNTEEKPDPQEDVYLNHPEEKSPDTNMTIQDEDPLEMFRMGEVDQE